MRQRSGTLRRLRRSRQAGIFGLLVFVAGVLVLPFLHNLHHRNDHDHGGGGWHTHGLAFGGHRHPHGHDDDHDDGRHRAAEHPDGDDDHDAPDSEHGWGSLEHFGVAVTASQVFVLPTTFTLVAQAVLPEFESVHVERYQLGPLQPRAPPA